MLRQKSAASACGFDSRAARRVASASLSWGVILQRPLIYGEQICRRRGVHPRLKLKAIRKDFIKVLYRLYHLGSVLGDRGVDIPGPSQNTARQIEYRPESRARLETGDLEAATPGAADHHGRVLGSSSASRSAICPIGI